MPDWCCRLHEMNMVAGNLSLGFVVPYDRSGSRTYRYTIDLVALEQRNEDTGTVRAIRRTAVFVLAGPPWSGGGQSCCPMIASQAVGEGATPDWTGRTQRNLATGKIRAIRRVATFLTPAPFADGTVEVVCE